MSRLFRLALVASALAVMAGSRLAGATPDATGASNAPASAMGASGLSGKRITIEFRDTPALDALMRLAKEAGKSIAFRGEIPKTTVNASLRDVDVAPAMVMVCGAIGLTCEPVPEGWVISSRPTVSVSGSNVPVLGALSVGGDDPTTIFSSPVFVPSAYMPPLATAGFGTAFAGDDTLVDLDVKDVPVRVTIADLSKASGIPITVAPGVSPEIKVSARIYRMRLGDVLILITDRANLTYTTERTEKGIVEVNIVPKPMLEVSGPTGVQVLSTPYLSPRAYLSPGASVLLGLYYLMSRHFAGENKLVDLDVKDAPIREAMSRLSEAAGIRIVVAEGVPKEIKIMARLYRMPLRQVLSSIVQAANLIYTATEAPKGAEQARTEIFIVPKPELKVTGPGVPPAGETGAPTTLPGTYVP